MPKICKKVQTIIKTSVTVPLETWTSTQQKKCRNRRWPMNWFCWFVTTIVKIITWIIKEVVQTIISIVCTFVSWILFYILGWIPWIYHNFRTCNFEVASKKAISQGLYEYTFNCRCNKDCDDKTTSTVVAADEKTAVELAKKDCNDKCK
jgi:hypothetical protein